MAHPGTTILVLLAAMLVCPIVAQYPVSSPASSPTKSPFDRFSTGQVSHLFGRESSSFRAFSKHRELSSVAASGVLQIPVNSPASISVPPTEAPGLAVNDAVSN